MDLPNQLYSLMAMARKIYTLTPLTKVNAVCKVSYVSSLQRLLRGRDVRGMGTWPVPGPAFDARPGGSLRGGRRRLGHGRLQQADVRQHVHTAEQREQQGKRARDQRVRAERGGRRGAV